MSSTNEKYLRVAAGFTQRIAQCPPEHWDSPSPCEGWSAADVVEHVITVHRGVLSQIDADVSCVENETLAQRWKATSEGFVAAMNDPELAAKPVAGPLGTVASKQLAGSIVLHDLLVHTWDLAVATNQSEELDDEAVRVALEKMQPMSDFIRGPGMFGAPVASAENASVQTQFLCFVGRSPLR
jgi:uncharacterized protein (TIGR03086 family)